MNLCVVTSGVHMKALGETQHRACVCSLDSNPWRVGFASSYLLKQTWQAELHHS